MIVHGRISVPGEWFIFLFLYMVNIGECPSWCTIEGNTMDLQICQITLQRVESITSPIWGYKTSGWAVFTLCRRRPSLSSEKIASIVSAITSKYREWSLTPPYDPTYYEYDVASAIKQSLWSSSDIIPRAVFYLYGTMITNNMVYSYVPSRDESWRMNEMMAARKNGIFRDLDLSGTSESFRQWCILIYEVRSQWVVWSVKIPDELIDMDHYYTLYLLLSVRANWETANYINHMIFG
jgi:hypothetical protein